MVESRVTETHISTLFFTEDRVYKLLKPIQNGFLDHRDDAERCEAAAREFELNHRLSPDVYLGTADVIENDELVDRMIVMRRLSETQSLTSLLQSGDLDEDHIRTLARLVANFHAGQEALTPDEPIVETHQHRWAENLSELAEFVGPVLAKAEVERVEQLASSWLDSHHQTLETRVANGMIIDGHGDLIADDIFFTENGPQVLDCLAFRDDFRRVDVLDDVAFLAMDLHRLAGPHWAQRLLHYYHEFSAEIHPGSLAHYYVAYRAHVRCKVACLRWKDGEHEQAEVARLYHQLCLDHLERARLRVVMIGGGPASGKTMLAAALATQLGAAVVTSDEVRKDLAGIDRTTHNTFAPDGGIYSPEFTEQTYDEILRQAELIITSGSSVILDANWATEASRMLVVDLAERTGAELIPIECVVPLAIAKERIVRRSANPMSVSDATPEIAEYLWDRREAWPDAVAIDTARPFHEVETDALHEIRSFARDGWVGEPAPGESFWGARQQ